MLVKQSPGSELQTRQNKTAQNKTKHRTNFRKMSGGVVELNVNYNTGIKI